MLSTVSNAIRDILKNANVSIAEKLVLCITSKQLYLPGWKWDRQPQHVFVVRLAEPLPEEAARMATSWGTTVGNPKNHPQQHRCYPLPCHPLHPCATIDIDSMAFRVGTPVKMVHLIQFRVDEAKGHGNG